MSKIAVVGFPGYGHAIPMLAPTAELVRRGHDVRVFNVEDFEGMIRATGATFVPYVKGLAVSDFARTLKTGSIVAGLELVLRTTPPLADFCIAELSRDRPDVVVIDAVAVWGAIAAKTLKLPTVAESPMFVFDMKQHLSGWTELRTYIRQTIPKAVRIVRAWRKMLRFGIRNWPLYSPQFPMRGDKTILLTSRELHPPSRLFTDPSWVFAGAAIDPRTRNEPFDYSRLDGRPLILVSLGTVQYLNHGFFRTVMDTFADFPAQFVLAAGPGTDIASLGPIPENFIVEKIVPQLGLLERAALFVLHGGLGSVHETLWSGVPFVAVPQHFEQMHNSRAAARHGAGIVLDAQCYGRAVSGPELRKAVETVLADPAYWANAKRLGDGLRDAGGYMKVADIIESAAAGAA